eukprot:7381603-Karenia_brevis.AAC.1
MKDKVEGFNNLHFMADFADDGVIEGDVDDVLKVVQGEIALGREYGVHNNFDKMVLYTLAGNRFAGDVSGFERLGIKVDYS